jgi:hypothetical protein
MLPTGAVNGARSNVERPDQNDFAAHTDVPTVMEAWRKLSFRIASGFMPAGSSRSGAAAAGRLRLNRSLRRRLSDQVDYVFQAACLSGDLATAEDLLGVLERIYARRAASMPERRLNDDVLVNARSELARRKSTKPSA